MEAAIGPKTRAIFIPHTIGIPADLDVLTALAKKHNLWLLEDGCDALGSTWDGKLVGTFGAMSSISFYPAHHMTMGEGGMVIVNHGGVRKTCLSVRDWGRDCWCDPGVSDTCGKRFGWQLGDLPFGYDHKYTYSNLGYNFEGERNAGGHRLCAISQTAGLHRRTKKECRFLDGAAARV